MDVDLHLLVKKQNLEELSSSLNKLAQESDHFGPDLDIKDSNKATLPIPPSIINKKDHLKRTPLHIAAFSGNTEIVTELITHGAKVNIPAQDGMTPLHFAALNGHLDVVKLLVRHGANINARTAKRKETAHKLALKYNKNEVATYLDKKKEKSKKDKQQ